MEKQFKPNPNAFKNTFCVFYERPLSVIEGLKLQFESKAGSRYFYTIEGMYRLSNHWGRLANSKWRLVLAEDGTDAKFKLGFASWDTFYPDNNDDKLYYLTANYSKQTILYEHKNNPNYDGVAVLRTSLETKKRIKQARNILELSSWANYFEYSDLNLLRKKIIDALIFTEHTLEDIKRANR
tara:strand:- start:778 stop:1323 length:546 start_codon:yes stop_codon:yes gene_type:complete